EFDIPPTVVGGIWPGSKEKPNFEEDMVGSRV
ncbi:MAG: hypothetical protein QOH96_2341, partial [Blastocatellia bacterium]|nr:hypothetical protein [Blastocatellia bacterium]